MNKPFVKEIINPTLFMRIWSDILSHESRTFNIRFNGEIIKSYRKEEEWQVDEMVNMLNDAYEFGMQAAIDTGSMDIKDKLSNTCQCNGCNCR